MNITVMINESIYDALILDELYVVSLWVVKTVKVCQNIGTLRFRLAWIT